MFGWFKKLFGKKPVTVEEFKSPSVFVAHDTPTWNRVASPDLVIPITETESSAEPKLELSAPIPKPKKPRKPRVKKPVVEKTPKPKKTKKN